MSRIACGHCKGRHFTIADVRNCSVATRVAQQLAAVAVAERPTSCEDCGRQGVVKGDGHTVTTGYNSPSCARVAAEVRASEYAASCHEVADTLEVHFAAARRRPYPQVAQGFYAVASRTGHNDLDFFRVDRPTEGKWAGRTFVKRVIGGKADSPVRGDTARAALEAILAVGEREASRKYGQEIGRCGRCNRHLTDETSRAYGLGPDCRSK